MMNLHRGGEQHDVNLILRKCRDGIAQRADVFGKLPSINMDGKDLRAALLKASVQLGTGHAMLLHGHAPASERNSVWVLIERLQNLAPGVGFGNGQSDGHAELTQN